jgi:[acyl-carrier-protein] S-malonyltransferase
MAAILGLSADEVAAACREAASAGVAVPANLNAPGQIVISGDPAAVDAACEHARARGAKRAIRLDVSGAFHSPLMGPAASGLARAIDETPMSDASVPVIANVSAEPVQKADEIRAALKAQLLGAVRWEDTMRGMIAAGTEGFVEVGTGKVLRGLLRSVDKQAQSWNVEDPESLNTTLEALGLGRVGAAGA